MAQSGSAFGRGPKGRWFKSSRPDFTKRRLRSARVVEVGVIERDRHRRRPTLDEALRARRSIRRYVRRQVPDEVVGEILDLARYAPSSLGEQPWSFIVIRDPETRRGLAAVKNAHCPPGKRESYPADFVADAPVVVVVCVERSPASSRERETGILAAAYVLLAAHARGLGGVYMTAYQPHDSSLATEVASQLRLPPQVEPVALLPLGFPAETPAPKQLRPLAGIVHHEVFGGPPRDG